MRTKIKSKRGAPKSNNRLKLLKIVLGTCLFISLVICLSVYYVVWYPNVDKWEAGERVIALKEDMELDRFVDYLSQEDIIINKSTFLWLASVKKFKRAQAGKYKVSSGMGNNALINLIRQGSRFVVKVTFNNIRTKAELSQVLTKDLSLDSAQLHHFLHDGRYLYDYDLTPENVVSIFLPDTYEFYWSVSAEDLFLKIYKHYQAYWNEERLEKAGAIGLSAQEVSTLASIVEEETLRDEEMPRVAGLYINRLKKNMLLQADPTVKFAVNDFSLRRVLTVHTRVDSPYNTYRYKGLPPGPIRVPSIASIEAVLNYEKHDYLYMCAKADFSGVHSFAKTHHQHSVNARAYQNALNRKRIYK